MKCSVKKTATYTLTLEDNEHEWLAKVIANVIGRQAIVLSGLLAVNGNTIKLNEGQAGFIKSLLQSPLCKNESVIDSDMRNNLFFNIEWPVIM